MAKFQFRLQTLLRLREADRQRRRGELAQAYRAEEILRQQRDFLAAEETEMRKRMQVASGPGPVQVDQLLDTHRYAIMLQARAKALEEQQARLLREIERRRQVLVEADREVRVLEKLRDRLLAQYRAEEAKQELKQLDEVAQRCGGPADP